MKTKFEVLRNRPQLTISLTRDSVCAADDCNAPHQRDIQTYSFTDPTQFIREVSSGYLPTVAGIDHTWDCMLNDVRVGRISDHGISPLVKEITYLQENRAHFRYNSSTH